MFKRVNSDVVPFSINSPTGNRYAFGTTDVSNDIDVNYNENIKKGFGTGPNEFPELEDFNALMFTGSYLAAYLYQAGIPEWNDKQKYYINSIAMGSDGNLYKSLTGTEETPNVDNDPILAGSTSWKSILSDYALINGDKTKRFKVADAVEINEAINKKQLDALQSSVNSAISNIQTLPIGAILNGYTIFDNCIVAFGGEFNRADYPKLWAYLQANSSLVKTEAQWQSESTSNGGICGFYSDGNGTTTFRVPNLDKSFLRHDSRTIASYQADMFKSHSHSVKVSQGYIPAGSSNFSAAWSSSTPGIGSTNSVGGIETRPKNIAVLPLIVAK